MPREVTIPAKVAHEEIANIDENPSTRVVHVRVAMVDPDTGKYDMRLGIEEYNIYGDDYDELTGPATSWAPDKPTGTYRNSDLWHFIDKQRNENA
jgi:hypothetical protein